MIVDTAMDKLHLRKIELVTHHWPVKYHHSVPDILLGRVYNHRSQMQMQPMSIMAMKFR